jgi:hypothetical protein
MHGQSSEHGQHRWPSDPPDARSVPIAFFVAAFVCDLVYWQAANEGWAARAALETFAQKRRR